MKGGKREGAGRPKAEPTTPVMLRLTDRQRDKYLELGGARWVKRLIDEEIEKTQAKGKS
jgi:hypothetical protein